MNTAVLFVLYLTAAIGLALWNRSKGHGFWLGFLYSVFLTPVIGGLTIAFTEHVVYVNTGTGVKRSCPRCFALTPLSVSFCEVCGANILRNTVKNYLQLAELFVGLVATVVIVRLLT